MRTEANENRAGLRTYLLAHSHGTQARGAPAAGVLVASESVSTRGEVQGRIVIYIPIRFMY